MKAAVVKSILLGMIFIGIFWCVWYFDLMQYLSLSFLQQQMVYLRQVVEKQYVLSLITYAMVVFVIIACMIPAVGPLTLLGGYLFGVIAATATILAGFICGVSVSFLVIRYVLASFLPERWMRRRDAFASRIREYGAWYIFTLNVVTVVPLIVINTLAALSDITLIKFICASVAGSFPMIIMYAFAGRTFAQVSSISEVFSPSFIIILLLLAVLSCIPMIVKRITNMSIDDV